VNRQLLHYEAKATPWLPLLFGAGFALVFAFIASTRDPYLASRLNLTRVALLCLAAGAAFLLDDRARDITDPLPTPLRRRRVARTLPAATFLVAAGTTVLGMAAAGLDVTLAVVRAPGDTAFPATRIGLEAAATTLLPISLAAVLGKRWDPTPGRLSAAAVVLVWMGSWLLPGRLQPWEVPGADGSMTSAVALTAFASLALLVSLVASWDSTQPSLSRPRTPLLTWQASMTHERRTRP
jgi:hypothetical protein